MRDFIILFVHVIVTVVRLVGPGGLRSVFAESALVRHQLLILNRGLMRAPNLCASDRLVAGLLTLLMRPARILRSAIVLKPATLLHLHSLLRKRKYHLLFSPQRGHRPGPKGPNRELIDAVVAMKQRNPNWGRPRIAQQIALAFGVEIDYGCGAPDPERSLPAGIGFSRSILADVSRPNEGQSVELRFVPMRIRHLEDPLGSRCDGPIHSPHRRFWRPQRRRRRSGAMLYVPSRNSRTKSAQIPQLGS